MKRARGFTLIEMAVVLVIIGLILGAVMKAKDIIRSAQVKEFTNDFVLAWKDIVFTYYDRKGEILGDGPENGGTWWTRNGYFDNFNGTSQGDKIVGNATEIGIDPCAVIKTDISNNAASYCSGIEIFKKSVAGEFTKSSVEIWFSEASTPSGVNKNVLIFQNVPSDVARAIDVAIDGHQGADTGNVLLCTQLLPGNPSNCSSGTDWSDPTDASTDNLGLVIEF